MPIFSLEIDDFSGNEYTLIGIHTTLEDYKLAYLLNKYLNIKLVQATYSLDFKNENNIAVFPVYEYINKKLDHDWFLISNIYKDSQKKIDKGLFSESDSITYLIPEKKKVDYFIKLEGDFEYDFIIKSVDKINQIAQIITSYRIEVNTLKSKEFLIF